MATKRKQIGFYADEDVEQFLDRLDPGVKTKTINDALRAWCNNPVTVEAFEKLQNKLSALENNHIRIGSIIWRHIKDEMNGRKPASDLETFRELLDCLGHERTGMLLGPDDYTQYRFFDQIEMQLIENALKQGIQESKTLAEKYRAFDHQEYAKHYRSLAEDFANLNTRLKVSRRLKFLSFEAGLLSEALMSLFYACQADETKKDIMKLREKLLTVDGDRKD
jgi:hypothetical protein